MNISLRLPGAAGVRIGIAFALWAAATVHGSLSGTVLQDLEDADIPEYSYPRSDTFLASPWPAQAFFAFTLAAYEEPDRTLGDSVVVADRAVEMIRDLIVNPPSCRGGIWGWFDGRYANGLLLARRTPAVWDQLTAPERERVDWLMRGFAIAGHFCMDDGNDYHQMVDGDGNFQKTWNPNHIEGYVAAVIAASLYFGPDELNEIFRSFDFDTYITKYRGLNFDNIANCWTRLPETKALMMTGGDSVSSGVVNPGLGGYEGHGLGVRNDFTYKGEPLDNPFGIYRQLALVMYRYDVVSSIENPGGPEIKIIGEATGATTSPWEGQFGMMAEFNSGDANGVRSDAHYCWDGLMNSLPTRATLQALGVWPAVAESQDIADRMNVGVNDFEFKVTEVYQGFSKGAQHTIGVADLAPLGFYSMMELFEDVEDGLASPPSPLPEVPAGPTGLEAVTGETAVALTWTDNAGNEDGYEVRRSFENGDWELLVTLPADTASYADESPEVGGVNIYAVRAINAAGPSVATVVASSIYTDPGAFVSIAPEADAQIRDGAAADTSYGVSTTLDVRGSPTAGANREVLIRFDVSPYDGEVARAVLKLNCTTEEPGSVTLYAVDADWDETVTWNTSPGEGTSLQTVSLSSGVNEIDLTSLVNAAIEGDGAVSLRMADPAQTDAFVSFTSRESATAPSLDLYFLTVLPVTEDTYVRAGTYSDDNFATNELLDIKAAGGSDYTRKTLLKWDVSSFTERVHSATIELTLRWPVVTTLSVFLIDDDSWSADTVTWNTMPAESQNSARPLAVVDGPNVVDITDWVNAAIASDGTLSVAVFAPDGTDTYVGYMSSETGSGPVLKVDTFLDHEPGPGILAEYDLVDGIYVDTGAWLGTLYVPDYPWVYAIDLHCWIWLYGADSAPAGVWYWMIHPE